MSLFGYARHRRTAQRLPEAARGRIGLPRYLADKVKFCVPGPLLPFVNVDGACIEDTSNLHPFGPQRRKYRGLDDSDSEVDAGVSCAASRYGHCTVSCCLCRGNYGEGLVVD